MRRPTMRMRLPISSSGEIENSLLSFVQEIPSHKEEAKRLACQTTYWVYYPHKKAFGPGKFVGYPNTGFASYDSGYQADGHISKKAIEKLLGPFRKDKSLSLELKTWARDVITPSVFDGSVKDSKWRFVVLPQSLAASEPVREIPNVHQPRYWVTTHYPMVSSKTTALWVYPKFQKLVANLNEGDRVAIYEAGRNKNNGSIGRKAVVLLGVVESLLLPPEIEVENGKTWLKIAQVKPMASKGKCSTLDFLRILKPGASVEHSPGSYLISYGGKIVQISEQQFDSIGSYFEDYVSTTTEAQKAAVAAFENSKTSRVFGTPPEEVKNLVESYSMSKAEDYLTDHGYNNVRDVSSNHPYDFECQRQGTRYFVEVKGTQTKAESVVLTANEVRHAKSHANTSILFILSEIRVYLDETNKLIASGGQPTCFAPWEVNDAQLSPIAYYYSLNKPTSGGPK